MFRRLKQKIRNIFFKNDKSISFKKEFETFNLLDEDKKLTNNWDNIYPCLNDNTPQTNFDSHYIYHPAWAARIVKTINPTKHIDISSTLHFCSILSAFIPVDFYDFRKATLNLANLNSYKGDLMSLDFETDSK